VKCTSVLGFYKLKGRTTTIIKENIEPILYLQYVYLSPLEKIYYLKSFPNYSLDVLFFSEKEIIFGEEDAVDILKLRIADNNTWLLFRKEQVSDMSAMLVRLWKANRVDEGKLGYKDWLNLAELSLKRENYVEYSKNTQGYKTGIKMFDEKIADIWKNCKANAR
jgi:hypothetical protein